MAETVLVRRQGERTLHLTERVWGYCRVLSPPCGATAPTWQGVSKAFAWAWTPSGWDTDLPADDEDVFCPDCLYLAAVAEVAARRRIHAPHAD